MYDELDPDPDPWPLPPCPLRAYLRYYFSESEIPSAFQVYKEKGRERHSLLRSCRTALRLASRTSNLFPIEGVTIYLRALQSFIPNRSFTRGCSHWFFSPGLYCTCIGTEGRRRLGALIDMISKELQSILADPSPEKADKLVIRVCFLSKMIDGVIRTSDGSLSLAAMLREVGRRDTVFLRMTEGFVALGVEIDSFAEQVARKPPHKGHRVSRKVNLRRVKKWIRSIDIDSPGGDTRRRERSNHTGIPHREWQTIEARKCGAKEPPKLEITETHRKHNIFSTESDGDPEIPNYGESEEPNRAPKRGDRESERRERVPERRDGGDGAIQESLQASRPPDIIQDLPRTVGEGSEPPGPGTRHSRIDRGNRVLPQPPDTAIHHPRRDYESGIHHVPPSWSFSLPWSDEPLEVPKNPTISIFALLVLLLLASTIIVVAVHAKLRQASHKEGSDVLPSGSDPPASRLLKYKLTIFFSFLFLYLFCLCA